jgi:O-antigen/teichoic acid export membrane protein
MWPAFLVALGGVLFAPVIITTTYGGAYASAILPFQILIWMIPVAWLSGHFRFSLIAAGHQRMEFAASAISGLATPVLAYIGIRLYGAPGAAAALVAGGVINAIAAWVFMHRVIGAIRMTSAARPLVACVSCFIVGIAVASLAGWAVSAATACGLYTLVAASQWNLTRLRAAWEGRLT